MENISLPGKFPPRGIDAHSRNLLCLNGFGRGRKPERAGVPDSRMLALLGLLCMKTRASEGFTRGVVSALVSRSRRIERLNDILAREARSCPWRIARR